MEFYLVNNKKLRFPGDKENEIFTHFVTRNTEKDIIAEMEPVVKNYATEQLANNLTKNLFKPRDNDKINWDLNLEIEIPSILHSDDDNEDDSIYSVAYMKLNAYGENNFLNRMGKMVSDLDNISGIHFKFLVNHFGPSQAHKSYGSILSTNWQSENEKVNLREPDEDDESSDVVSQQFRSYCDFVWQHNLKEDMITAWKTGEDFQGFFTILLVLPVCVLSMLMLPEHCYFTMFRKMLDKKIEMDVKFVASNGATVKCHRAIIAASNEKLADLLKKEPGNRMNFMIKLTQSCIKALMEYIYCRDINRAVRSANIATQVLEAALRFEMIDLVEVTRKVLLVRPNQWFGVDDAVCLFLLANTQGIDKDDSSVSKDDLSGLEDISSDSEDELKIERDDADENGDNDSNSEISEATNQTDDYWEPLKKRSVEVLKWYSKNRYKDLMASSKYRQLFRETPQVAMEVGKLFLQLG